MVRTIGRKEIGPVKRNTLGQKLYSRSKWFGSKLYDGAKTAAYGAAAAALPVVGAAIYKGVVEPRIQSALRPSDLISGGVAGRGSVGSMLTPPPSQIKSTRNPLYSNISDSLL